MFLSSQYQNIDLDGDGRADLIKSYKNGKLTKVVFSLTRQTSFKIVTDHYPDGRVEEKEYQYSRIVSKKTTTKSSQDLIEEIEKYWPLRSKMMKTYRGQFMNEIKYKLDNNAWVVDSNKTAKIEKVNEVTRPSQTWDIPIQEIIPVEPPITQLPRREPLGYRINPDSCNDFNNRVLSAATHEINDNILPCLTQANPILAGKVVQHLGLHRNQINCLDDDNCSSDDVFGCVDLRPDTNIYMVSATPDRRLATLRNRNQTPTDHQLVSQTAAVLFHETLHFVTNTRHQANEVGFTDLVYGCQSLCADGATRELGTSKPVDYRRACPACMFAGIPNGLRATQRQRMQFVCDREDPAPDTSRDLRLCALKGGVNRANGCFCVSQNRDFDPNTQQCAPPEYGP